ncbi:hypothetical protein DRJ04_00320 [Candidatus Aerophobetes bacterium]|uniref:Transposase n=1 Tax=Aerophobetes bacterium TaxID=2030807 RepID=A0A662DKM5_UNCAE|nr:MAG: hypothetical protein DRJ04_00320 [Candidatus Aerophobetes bacterium]
MNSADLSGHWTIRELQIVDHRNGYRKRNFETVYGPLKGITIPRARNRSFTPQVIPKFKRRQGRIGAVLSPECFFWVFPPEM